MLQHTGMQIIRADEATQVVTNAVLLSIGPLAMLICIISEIYISSQTPSGLTTQWH